MNNDYNNFNNFNTQQNNPQPNPGTSPDPNQQPYQQQPYQQQPYQQQPYQQQPYQQQPYQQQYTPYAPVQGQKESNTMGILSIVFSSLAIFCCGIPFGITGIILGALYAKKNSKSPLGWIGLGIGILAIIIAIASIIAMGGVEGYTDMLDNITNQI